MKIRFYNSERKAKRCEEYNFIIMMLYGIPAEKISAIIKNSGQILSIAHTKEELVDVEVKVQWQMKTHLRLEELVSFIENVSNIAVLANDRYFEDFRIMGESFGKVQLADVQEKDKRKLRFLRTFSDTAYDMRIYDWDAMDVFLGNNCSAHNWSFWNRCDGRINILTACRFWLRLLSNIQPGLEYFDSTKHRVDRALGWHEKKKTKC